MIRILLIFWFIISSLRHRVAPWNFFQLNSEYFNEEKGIFSKLDIDNYIHCQWRLKQCYESGENMQNTFPVFMKPEWGQNSHGILRADTLKQYQRLRKRAIGKSIAYIVQEAAKEQREFEIFYIRSPIDTDRHSLFSVTEVTNSGRESFPINGIHNANTIYTDCTAKFTSNEINKLWTYLKEIGPFRLARVGLRSNSLGDLLAGRFHIIEINLFLPMPLYLLDKKISCHKKHQFIRHSMLLAALAVKAIPRSQKHKPLFFKKVFMHYKIKSWKM